MLVDYSCSCVARGTLLRRVYIFVQALAHITELKRNARATGIWLLQMHFGVSLSFVQCQFLALSTS